MGRRARRKRADAQNVAAEILRGGFDGNAARKFEYGGVRVRWAFWGREGWEMESGIRAFAAFGAAVANWRLPHSAHMGPKWGLYSATSPVSSLCAGGMSSLYSAFRPPWKYPDLNAILLCKRLSGIRYILPPFSNRVPVSIKQNVVSLSTHSEYNFSTHSHFKTREPS